ncbi:conserved hypothetical protein [Mucor ambiguus]|uniref:Uncharacterized protein n=1 Tax=Mucor ambiguus TaxID=91626 RepID=A0A0C9MWQ1_9FUNG|nr:conserved hypothetical protein [Mucor ambiguus]
MTTVKPIIKLPPRSKSCSTRSTYQDMMSPYDTQSIVSNELYFEDKENRLQDYDIQHLLQDYSLYQIKRERGGGYLSFPDSKMADRVYSLFNGYMFANQTVLKFKLSSNDLNDPQPEGYILEIRHLPTHMDHNSLYDIFRPFGPLSICKPITEDGTLKGKALVQFFYKEDSDVAVNSLNNKMIDGSIIQIHALMMNSFSSSRYMTQSMSTPTSGTTTMVAAEPTKESTGFVDYMNLYVKNLDPTVDNTDLFNIFRKYGRIVSARVMSNPATGLSKGYGFVSFGKPEEAALALKETDGMQYRTKPMIVAYHEPKKPRQEKSTSTTTSSFHSPPSTAPIDYATTPYFETRHPHEVGPLGLGIDNVDQLAMNHAKDLPVGGTAPPPLRRNLSMDNNSFTPPPIRTSPQFASRPSLASLASGVSIQQAPVSAMYEKIEQEKILEEKPRTLRRKGSLESVSSVMTESSAQVQRQRMTEAVKRCGSYGNDLADIVDMLLTLKKKERSICLFNPDFLKDKINAAVEALEICEDDEDDEDEDELHRQIMAAEKKKENRGVEIKARAYVPSPPKSPLKKRQSVSPPRVANRTVAVDNVVIPPRKSKAIPIIAPPILDTLKAAEIKAMLASFEGKAIHEKKQLLGDQLFPLVKATGIKHAPKITIRLLDTIELETLAEIMFDKEALKTQVDKASANL